MQLSGSIILMTLPGTNCYYLLLLHESSLEIERSRVRADPRIRFFPVDLFLLSNTSIPGSRGEFELGTDTLDMRLIENVFW